jgi:menaquinone-dependent protoporphyrinogen oxidase
LLGRAAARGAFAVKANILILYSTVDGHTLKICRRLQALVAQDGHQVELVSIEEAQKVDLAAFDKIVIGAGIRYGRHNPKVAEFIRRNRSMLDAKANAFFSVNLVARKPEKSQPDSNPYLRKFLRRIAWKPKKLAVFAGKLDYPKYSLVDRCIIRFIMWLTNGPTDPGAVAEYTDWLQVEAFGRAISEL